MSAPTNSRKTVETDAFFAFDPASKPADFCRSMEAQRDEARDSLADIVDMNESLLKSIAEYSKDPRILAMPSPRLIKARSLLTPKPTP